MIRKHHYRYLKTFKCFVFACMVLLMTMFFSDARGQSKTIQIIHASVIEVDPAIADGAQRLLGKVEFEHEEARMFCDSAYFWSDKKLVYAFSNVHIIQADTINLYGDSAIYRGGDKMAEFRQNVKLDDGESVLTTGSLDFDLEKNVGYYYDHGIIKNANNTLKSIKGYYYSEEKLFAFKDSVVINNPKYDIYSDTLHYNTETKVSYFFGPTEIIGEENYIYCENGWYNSETDICQFNKNAFLSNKNQFIKGDSIYYERISGFGKAFLNVEIIDTTRDVILMGHYANYYENPESTLLTDSALCVQVNGTDSLFIHGDTLRSSLDTLGKKVIKGYYKVKFYRHNMQGMCDSLVYAFSDSTIKLYTKPVIWSSNNQLKSELMKIYTDSGSIDYVELIDNAFIAAKINANNFNQIKGKMMTGYFKGNDLHKIDVDGNAETIYFTESETDAMNKAICSDLVILLKDSEVQRIKMHQKPEASLLPLSDPGSANNKLKGFEWLDKHRPKKVLDIFYWNKE